MTGPIFSCTLVGCVFAMSLMAQSAKAADGRIVFSGAVVEPTCRVDPQNPDITRQLAPAARASERVACAGASGVTSAMPQAYTLTVAQLSTETPDHLLRYFAGYVETGSTDMAAARMVTQTYD